jgi:hypothetical protein
MVNNPRQAIKRDLDAAINHVEHIQEILTRTGEKYRADHPEILQQYETTFAFFEQAKELLNVLRDTY